MVPLCESSLGSIWGSTYRLQAATSTCVQSSEDTTLWGILIEKCLIFEKH